MSKVQIITDSTSYIPKELLEKYNIIVIPQVLIWGDETYEDGIDILPEEYYKRLETAKVMPSTSQATPGTFSKIFNKLAEAGSQDILAVLISNKLSGTIASAIQAQKDFEQLNIEIIDSQTTAMALGFQALTAARAAADGATLKECKALIENAYKNTGVVFAVNTLEFLYRGGRIGGANRFLGTALNIKPILEVVDGRVEGIERVRTRKKSLERVLELVEERIAGRKPVRIATLHANAKDEAQALLNQAREHFTAEEFILAEVSPVIGTHAGPGTLGLAFSAGI